LGFGERTPENNRRSPSIRATPAFFELHLHTHSAVIGLFCGEWGCGGEVGLHGLGAPPCGLNALRQLKLRA